MPAAEVFAFPLTVGEEIIARRAGRQPLHLFRYFLEQTIGEQEGRFGESHVQLVLPGEKAKLLSLGWTGWVSLHAPASVEERAEHDAVQGLGKLNRAVKQNYVHASADDLYVLCVRRLCGIHRRTGQCVPHARCRRRGGSLRANASYKK